MDWGLESFIPNGTSSSKTVCFGECECVNMWVWVCEGEEVCECVYVSVRDKH